MKICDYFKNFKTKKQLREEIKQLESRLLSQSIKAPRIEVAHREIIPVHCALRVSNNDVLIAPEKAFLNRIACDLMDEIKKYIKYDVWDERDGGKTYTGTLHLVKMEGDENDFKTV